ncbi:hypothetical protein ES332_D12G171400v1 [Gossypium tomentosum]|uniref:Uncharacterized protein n=1 Tax=Gossypium tomentosum TaxID=34277 RepID=A0A5D2IB51_GOSTO|nr:hypothetical protein ES332_D12G171400v1 [Gossypium tomentosum]
MGAVAVVAEEGEHRRDRQLGVSGMEGGARKNADWGRSCHAQKDQNVKDVKFLGKKCNFKKIWGQNVMFRKLSGQNEILRKFRVQNTIQRKFRVRM